MQILVKITSKGIARLIIGLFCAISLGYILSKGIIKERIVIAFLSALALFGIAQGLAGILVIINQKSYSDLEKGWSKEPLIIKISLLVFVFVFVLLFYLFIGSMVFKL